ncbi:uncharacterized protein B0J16DRAFT_333871 [Fusarium flagelliforme]|uniref:uncharacterized protein n=1 Tax=Fusarium flagelliforme TaxID=2675880 RepID=UPI001E8E5C77|nr:uncharacterized protein B0J16DRAFT_333871 [Fusarium flagelliforme]KAH7192873.1 hypothetical protein B0J16DRAFT_333871 [Fusarium flagelliforme]
MSIDDVIVRGDGWSEKYKVDCSREWSSPSVPRLPCTIEFHPGNACDRTSYDNMWIKGPITNWISQATSAVMLPVQRTSGAGASSPTRNKALAELVQATLEASNGIRGLIGCCWLWLYRLIPCLLVAHLVSRYFHTIQQYPNYNSCSSLIELPYKL